MAIITWDGGGSTNDWSEAANWTTGVPGATDDVVFDATSTKASTVNAGFAGTVQSVDVNSGYIGTTTQARSLTVDGDFTLDDGTWSPGSNTLTIDGDCLIANTAGLFTAGTSTVDLTGTGDLANPHLSNKFNILHCANSALSYYYYYYFAIPFTTTLTDDVYTNRVQFNGGRVAISGGSWEFLTRASDGDEVVRNELDAAGFFDTTFLNDGTFGTVGFDVGGSGNQDFDLGDYNKAILDYKIATGGSLTLFDSQSIRTLFTAGDLILDGGIAGTLDTGTDGFGGDANVTIDNVTFGSLHTFNMNGSDVSLLEDWDNSAGGTISEGTSTLKLSQSLGVVQTITSGSESFNIVDTAGATYSSDKEIIFAGCLLVLQE